MKILIFILFVFQINSVSSSEYKWEKIEGVADNFNYAFAEDPTGHLYISFHSLLYESWDDGKTWVLIHYPYNKIWDIYCPEWSGAYFSTDSLYYSSSNSIIKNISFNDGYRGFTFPIVIENILFAIRSVWIDSLNASRSFIYYSYDKGNSWRLHNFSMRSSLPDPTPVMINDNNLGFYFFAGDTIYFLKDEFSDPIATAGFTHREFYFDRPPNFVMGDSGKIMFCYWNEIYNFNRQTKEWIVITKKMKSPISDVRFFKGKYYFLYNRNVCVSNDYFNTYEILYSFDVFEMIPRLWMTSKGTLLLWYSDGDVNFYRGALVSGVEEDKNYQNHTFSNINNFIIYLKNLETVINNSLELYNILGQCIYRTDGISDADAIEELIKGENIIFYRLINNNHYEYGKILNPD